MINYSTEFPIDDKNTISDVLHLACKWITGSPHTSIPQDALVTLPQDSEIELCFGDETVVLGAAILDGFEIGGIRWTKVEDEALEWTTSIVTTKTPSQHLLSIQVLCEALNTAARLPAPRKPVFIRQALDELVGGMDGEIPVTDKPFYLDEGDVNIAAALMKGTAKNRLPIIYVSSGYDASHVVNPVDLAKSVSGMAHVIVEPSRNFSVRLKELTSSRNVYGGTVGVYWPESEARKSYYPDGRSNAPNAIRSVIARDIRVALSNRRQRTNCNWLHLKELISKRRYENLKAAGSTELDEFAEAFDEDQKAKEARIAEAEAEIARLNAELRRYAASSQHAGGGLLEPGSEQELYEGEIKDIVIQSLQEALRNAQDGGRRQHVIHDLLGNNVGKDNGVAIAEKIKAIFKTYVDMDAKTRGELEKLGFEISEDGKHYKAIFCGDERYTFVISKTSSDHRSGRNLASDINKRLF